MSCRALADTWHRVRGAREAAPAPGMVQGLGPQLALSREWPRNRADGGWHVRQKALLPVQSTLPTSSEREVTWATASLLLQSLTHGNKQLRVWDRMSNSFSQCVRAEVA